MNELAYRTGWPRRTAAAFLFLVGAALAQAQASRLFNISTRGPVGTGADIMIAGLVVGQGEPETVLIRAVGPSLVPLNVTGVLAAPVLTIFDSAGNVILSNQGWGNGNATAAIMESAGAFPLIAGSADSALVATLPAGAYTAQVSGANGTTGVVLLEIYEVGASAATARLVNLSTRGEVGTSGNIMIPGITIGAGSGERTLLIRAAGPALAALNVPGTLADPTMSVVDASGNIVASNDNWGTPIGDGSDAADLSAAFMQAGAFAFAAGSLDSALIATVPPGAYTVLVSGNAASSGVAIVEVYDITAPTQVSPGPNTVTIAATDPSADTSGGNTGTFTISRTGDTTSALVVNYLVSGSAVNGLDYQGLAGTVTIPAYASSAQVTVTPNPTLNPASTGTVVLTLGGSGSYSVGAADSATVAIQFIPPTLYVAQIRPTSGAAGSAGSGIATLLVSSDGSLASVSVSFSNLSSGESAAQLELGGDMGNGTTLIDFPAGQIANMQWAPAGVAQYTKAQVLAAIASGNVFVEIDSANYPSGELGGQLIVSTGSQVFSAPPAPPAIDLSTVPAADAPRFLTQATFGPTTADIGALESMGYSAWIASQMALPETSHRAATDADAAKFPPTGKFSVSQGNRQAAWWLISLTAPDQLRQRVAFALSEIFVTSDVASQLANQADGLANYYDLLANDAFGNFRTLLQDVTLSPAMGNYLNMLKNAKANAAKGTSADENYAREVQQLFTIGLNELQPDGTLKLDATGLPIPTYDQDEVVQTSNVFTGWAYHSAASNPSFYGTAADFDDPMMLYPTYHDESQKTIINGIVIPANQDGASDLKAELDALFNHPNTGPFICSQLIQRLVTSNPSPAYVYRVAQVFANDGTGTRGNLGAVVRAILLDYEARSPALLANAGYGKLKEPLLRMTGLYRAFGAAAQDGRFAILNAQVALGEAALRSPTVFNFFDPGYVQQGTLASAGLFAPEFEITTATTTLSVPNSIYSAIYTPATPAATTIVLNLSSLTANSSNPTAMVATLNQLLCANGMSAQTQQQILAALGSIPTSTPPATAAQMALYVAATSPDAAIQR
jgi:uncharacterized protein (DUF1800 family)